MQSSFLQPLTEGSLPCPPSTSWIHGTLMSASTLFGGGLIEISAIATLIGASTASSLALGNKGAGGLPWASMISTFGAVHVIKASLSAAVPDWMRDAAGLRGSEVDAAVGLQLPISGHKSKIPDDLITITAIQTLFFNQFLHIQPTDEKYTGDLLPSGDKKSESAKPVLLYSLDMTSRCVQRVIPESKQGLLHIYRVYPTLSTTRDPWSDRIVLLASCIKPIEAGILFWLGAYRLWWTSAIGWSISFTGALILHIAHLSRDDFAVARANILTGEMPTAVKPGGDGQVVLEMAGNVRRHWAWRVIWIANAAALLCSLISVFLGLSREESRVVYVWLAFQAFYMLARSVVHHIAESATSSNILCRVEPWEILDPRSRRQVLQLILALGKHIANTHPRGPNAYTNALTSYDRIKTLFGSAGWKLTETVQFHPEGTAEDVLEFVDVIGDTVFRSISWATNMQTPDTYDAAIVFLGRTRIAVPCVRVWSCNCDQRSSFSTQRGMQHIDTCTKVAWIFWIPYQAKNETGWLCVRSRATEGRLPVERLDPRELHKRLAIGTVYWISIAKEEEVRKILEVSRTLGRRLMEMFQDSL